MLGVVVVGQHVSAVQVAGDDGGTGYHSLKDNRLNNQGIEVGLALRSLVLLGLFQHFLELVGVVVDTGSADSVYVVAQLGQQGAVDVPGVLGGGVLQSGNGIDAGAVNTVGHGAVPNTLGNGALQLGGVGVQHVVQLDPVAVTGVLVVLVSRPVAGEVDVHVIAAGQSSHGSGIEIAPGAPDGVNGDIDLVLQVSIDLLHDLCGSVRGNVAAVEPDLDGHGVQSGSCGGVRSVVCTCVAGSGGSGSGFSGGRCAGTAGGQTKDHNRSQQQGQ